MNQSKTCVENRCEREGGGGGTSSLLFIIYANQTCVELICLLLDSLLQDVMIVGFYTALYLYQIDQLIYRSDNVQRTMFGTVYFPSKNGVECTICFSNHTPKCTSIRESKKLLMTTGYYLKTSIKNSVFIGFFSFQESHIITQLKKLTSLRLDGKRKEISKKFSVIIQKKKKLLS